MDGQSTSKEVHSSADASQNKNTEKRASEDEQEGAENLIVEDGENLSVAESSQISTTRIGITIFFINGRHLVPKEDLLSGKPIRSGQSSCSPYIWSNSPQRITVLNEKNIPFYEPGVFGAAKEVETEIDAFNIYITENILNKILTYTNEEIKISEYYILPKPNCLYPLSPTELNAFIGMLFFFAAKKQDDTLIDIDVHNSVMSEERFDYLLKCLRFDDHFTRDIRKWKDSFAEIRSIWDEFIKICIESYRPTLNCNIGEIFISCNGECNFKQRIPNDPHEYGIKLLLLCDSNYHYVVSCIPYLQKSRTGSISECMVEKLAAPLCGKNINITYSNSRLTSIPLSKKLLKYYKITTVSTLQKGLPEIPLEMILEKNRPVGTSIFVYNIEDKIQLCSYYPKKGKIKLFLSNKHFNSLIIGQESKPEVISYYESTRCSVNAVVKMIYGSSCSRYSINWFLSIFFTILDFAGINSLTILNLNRSKYGKPAIKRGDFLYKLALDLMLPFMRERLSDQKVSVSIKRKIKRIIKRQKSSSVRDPPNYTEDQTQGSMAITPGNGDKSNQSIKAVSKPNSKNSMLIKQETHHLFGPVIEIFVSQQYGVWDDIRDMYPPNMSNTSLHPVRPTIGTEQYQPNFTVDLLQAMYLPTQFGLVQISPVVPYFNYSEFPSQYLYLQQIRNLYIPIQRNIPYQATIWNLPNVTGPQFKVKSSPSLPVETVVPGTSIQNRQQNTSVSYQPISSNSQSAEADQQNSLVLNTQTQLPNHDAKHNKKPNIEQPSNPLHQLNQPSESVQPVPSSLKPFVAPKQLCPSNASVTSNVQIPNPSKEFWRQIETVQPNLLSSKEEGSAKVFNQPHQSYRQPQTVQPNPPNFQPLGPYHDHCQPSASLQPNSSIHQPNGMPMQFYQTSATLQSNSPNVQPQGPPNQFYQPSRSLQPNSSNHQPNRMAMQFYQSSAPFLPNSPNFQPQGLPNQFYQPSPSLQPNTSNHQPIETPMQFYQSSTPLQPYSPNFQSHGSSIQFYQPSATLRPSLPSFQVPAALNQFNQTSAPVQPNTQNLPPYVPPKQLYPNPINASNQSSPLNFQPPGPLNQFYQSNVSSVQENLPNFHSPSPHCVLVEASVASNFSHQVSTLRKELCVCGVCNNIGNKHFFMECFKCSVLLCMVHRKIVCSNCYKATQPAISGLASFKKGKCGICGPKNKIYFTTQCSKCLIFLCLEHRCTVCLFCAEV